jgi:hypothetical protein
MQDLLVVIMLAVLRIGVPAAVILGSGALVVRAFGNKAAADIQAPAEAANLAPAEWAKAMTTRSAAACWEQKNYDAAKRAKCDAHQHSQVPCWLAVQVSEGKLRGECVSCDLYHLKKQQSSPLRPVRERRADQIATRVG